jgi:Skp family chaperone for outer membrane proteins
MKNLVKFQLFWSFLALAVFPFGVNAVQKMGVVNMNKIFTNYYKTKLEDARIKKQSEVYREYLTSLNEARNKLNAEFVKLRDSAQNIAYSDAERENNRIAAQNKYRQLQAKDVEIQQYNDDKKKQLFDEYDKMRKTLIDEVVSVVRSKAKREKYTFVMDSSGNTMNSIPAVVYFDESVDFTDAVIKELNLGNNEHKTIIRNE